MTTYIKRQFTFDLNLIRDCNFRCNYCSIPFDGSRFKPEHIDKFIDKLKFLLESKSFNYDTIRVAFFGGEPTLNYDDILKITEAFRNNDRVIFFLYTNGYKYRQKIWDLLESFKSSFVGREPKFLTQISYDGLASHNVDRVLKSSKQTALEVKETIFEMAKRRIPFQVHPTIAAKNFDKLSENYFEFKRMSEILGMEFNYSPTIDYLTHYKFNKQELQSLKETLKLEFNKIAQDNIKSYNGNFRFGWFNPNKAICCAGNGYVGIELDGTVVPCHGCFGMATNDRELNITHLDEPNQIFMETLLKSSAQYSRALEFMPDECINCKTHYCLKCNAAKYANSRISTKVISTKVVGPEGLKYLKWTDYTNQPSLCELYKFIGLYRIALLKVIQGQD